jgi:FMN reductase
MRTATIVVVSAGLSVPSSTRLLADRLAAAAASALRGHGIEPEVQVVELREHARDLADHLVTGFPNADLRATIDAVTGADALIAVTPIFAASYSGLFKTFFDVIEEDALAGKPVLLGATAGTARHSLALDHALRPLFAHLRTIAVPTGVLAAAEDWGAVDGISRSLAERIDRAGGELADLVAGRPRAAAAAKADPFADVVPFEALLHRV